MRNEELGMRNEELGMRNEFSYNSPLESSSIL